MKTIDCLCFGACTLDQIEHTDQISVGGDAANQAILLKRLGMQSILCAGIGEDEAGIHLKNTLEQIGIDTSHLIVRDTWQTTHSLIHLDEHKERTFTVSGGAHRRLEKSDFPFSLIDQCKALSLGSFFTLEFLEEDGLKEIFEKAHQSGALVFSDTSTDRHHKGLAKVEEFLPLIDYFMPSYDEAKALTGKNEPDEIAEVLLNHGAKCVVLKLGSQGAALYRRNTKLTQNASPASVVNTTGAGDHFCAGFIASLLCGHSEIQALANGCWMGARAVEVDNCTQSDLSHLPYPLERK